MCQLFIGADPDHWSQRTKSLRIDGVATSIRLEAFFWATLEDIGARDELTVNQLITRLYREALEADHDMGNFTSFLRVCCARYLSLMAAGEISSDPSRRLREVDAVSILARERQRDRLHLRHTNATVRSRPV
ncbi:ribbon-helix-helix domain-containing protein [Tabrizicola sp. J26]|uniref:ribbon-helix-helix domain-containing protein n=1 Tax=Alitabrizicola rongguiensis TaxID=2909234 RepID=UPI001F211BFA|nr:ribbon-helix-helix domain-containing protein [Tabrizicola rongguiensis]MCF1708969.1 ribbon-helix-helix domain-containing protein [Tabrizicola rongguiensis]